MKKFKADSVLWHVDKEYSRWYKIETHGAMGHYTHKVLITAWKEESVGWRAVIVSPRNSRLGMGQYLGKSRYKAVEQALAAFEAHLQDNGEWT